MDRNQLGIVGYENEYPSQMDLLTFMVNFRTDATGAIPTIEVIDSRYNGRVGQEANLGVQYTLALAYPTPVIYYRGTGNGVQFFPAGDNVRLPGPGDQYLAWLGYMIAKRRMPQTISLAFSTPEPSISLEYAVALCELFAQLGARGTSVLAASGNAGVGRGDCRNFRGDVQYYTVFPASCMWHSFSP
jgi:tripeptidyl-peptidase-1